MKGVIKSGYLKVGQTHEIYWEDWGNPEATPIFHLHGGPGAGFYEGHKELYNSVKHRVIFHDQRGCGKSKPLGEINNNTTEDLINDIEKLRDYLNIPQMYLSGGSWGSTLSLLYAIAHPDRVKRMMLWGILLARSFEIDSLFGGYAKYIFPEAWERYIDNVPENKRNNTEGIMSFYFEKLCSSNKEEAQKYADEWALWDYSLVSLDYDWEKLKRDVPGDIQNLIMGKIALFFCLKKFFIPENYILDKISQIKQIPATVIQGRWDMCAPPVSSYDLAKAYGVNLKLIMVLSGHMRSDPLMFNALKKEAEENLI